MAVIDLESFRTQKKLRRAKGQMVALAHLREEVAGDGFGLAAQLLELAIVAIDQQMKEEPLQPPS